MLRLLLMLKKYTQNLTATCILNSVISSCIFIALFYFLSLMKIPHLMRSSFISVTLSLVFTTFLFPVSRSILASLVVERAWMLMCFFATFLLETPILQRAPDTLGLLSSFLRMSRTSLTQYNRCCYCLTKHLGKVTDRCNWR